MSEEGLYGFDLGFAMANALVQWTQILPDPVGEGQPFHQVKHHARGDASAERP